MARDTVFEAYILITVPHNIPHVMDLIANDKQYGTYVEELNHLFGGADVFAKIRVPSIEILHGLIIEFIQNIPDVYTTQTFFINPKLGGRVGATRPL